MGLHVALSYLCILYQYRCRNKSEVGDISNYFERNFRGSLYFRIAHHRPLDSLAHYFTQPRPSGRPGFAPSTFRIPVGR